MSNNSIIIHGTICYPDEDDIGKLLDIRHLGVLKVPLPQQIYDYPDIKKVLVYHDNVLQLLDLICPTLSPGITVKVFDDCDESCYDCSESGYVVKKIGNKFMYRCCDVRIDENGIILDIDCRSLKKRKLIFSGLDKVWELFLRSSPEENILFEIGSAAIDNLEELYLDCGCESYDICCQFIGFERNVSKLASLKKLTIRSCDVDDMAVILGQCLNLEELVIEENTNLPRISANISKLTSLKMLIISECDYRDVKGLSIRQCDLRDLPEGLGQCLSLEKLELYYNRKLQRFSANISKLTSLKELSIKFCDLRDLPEGLGQCLNLEKLILDNNCNLFPFTANISKLPSLKILSMKNCNLYRLPEGVGFNVETLDLAGNHLGESQLDGINPLDGLERLTNLRSLGLSDCDLTSVPEVVCELTNLRWLALRENNIRKLQKKIFTNGINVSINFDCPLEIPPGYLFNQYNNTRVLKYFQDIEKYGEVHLKRLRILVLGNSKAGKTSLINLLLTGVENLEPEDERTSGIQIRTWFPDPSENDLELDVWDYAGNESYQTLHNFYLQKGSFFLVVVDIYLYEETDASYDDHVGKWIDKVKNVVLRPVIVVVATKMDLLFNEWPDYGVNENFEGVVDKRKLQDLVPETVKRKCKHIAQKIEEEEKKDVESIEADIRDAEKDNDLDNNVIEKLKKLRDSRPVFPETDSADGALAVSAKKDINLVQNQYFIALQKEIGKVGTNDKLFPCLTISLPEIWVSIEKFLMKLKKENDCEKYISIMEVQKRLCQEYSDIDITEATLYAVLDYLSVLGKVFWFKDIEELKKFVFLDPNWLISFLKLVVRHDLKDSLLYREEFRAYSLDETNFDEQKQDLLERGMLSKCILRCIWHNVLPKDLDDVSSLLEHFHIGYRMRLTEVQGLGKNYENDYALIPALVPDTPTELVGKKWPGTCPNDHWEIESQYEFHSKCPNGLFELLMCCIHPDAEYTLHWKTGFFGCYTFENTQVNFCATKQKETNKTIVIAVRGKDNEPSKYAWKALYKFHMVFLHLVRELWPWLRYNIYNKCPECKTHHHQFNFERWLSTSDCKDRVMHCRINSEKCRIEKFELAYPSGEVHKELLKEIPQKREIIVNDPVADGSSL